MAKKKDTPEIKHYCGECAYAYDFHSKALDGHDILCRCPFFKFSKLVRYDTCAKWKAKPHPDPPPDGEGSV